MYIPRHNQMPDKNEVIAFMNQYSFATIVSNHDGKITATHLPFVIEVKEDDEIIILGHFAKANPQWKSLEGQEVLILFTEPHAYISPRHYESKINVPTWNYIAVHAYGICKLVTDETLATEIIEKTIDTFESGYKAQWETLPKEYIKANLNAIVAFECIVYDLQAKKKLSQNKTENERKHIIDQFSQSKDMNEQTIAAWMNKEF